jgi:hypothetical protein
MVGVSEVTNESDIFRSLSLPSIYVEETAPIVTKKHAFPAPRVIS